MRRNPSRSTLWQAWRVQSGAFALPLLLTLVAGSANGVRAAEDSEAIPEYESYKEVDFLRVNSGVVKAKRLGEKGWHIVIETPAAATPRRVTLTATDWDFMRLLPLRAAQDLLRQCCPAHAEGKKKLLKLHPNLVVH